MKIEVKKETYEFLKNLAHELNTQSCRATASPYGYIIQEKVKDYNLHEEGENILLIHDSEECCIKDYLENLIEEYADISEDHKVKLDNLCDYQSTNIEELKKNIADPKFEFDLCFYKDFADIYNCDVYTFDWIYETATGNGGGNLFLTEKAVKEHIKRNNYRYNEARDYLVYLFRNPEMEQLMSAVKEIAGTIK